MPKFDLLYHKPTQAVVLMLKKGTHQFSPAEQSGDFLVVEMDTADYNTTTKEITVTMGQQSRQVPLAVLAKKLDLTDYYDDAYELAQERAVEDWLHSRLGGE